MNAQDKPSPAPPKYAAKVPPSIQTPDTVQTRIGTLRFFDGLPDEDTVQMVYDNLDFGRGVEAFLAGIPATSVDALNVGLSEVACGRTRVLHHRRPGGCPRAVPHSELDRRLRLVLRRPQRRPDRRAGAAGRPGHHRRCLLPLRHRPRRHRTRRRQGRQVSSCATGLYRLPAERRLLRPTPPYLHQPLHRPRLRARRRRAGPVQNIKDSARVYALSAAADPPETTFVNISGVQFNTVQSNDFQFYEELNAVVRHEPADFVEPETAGLFAAIGIKKGQPFAPDARLKAILTDAVAVGNATARAIVFAPRDERTRFFPDRQWTTAFVGGSHEFMDRGERMLDVRALFHYYATGITPGDGSGAAGHRLGVWLHRPVTHKAATATAAKPTRSHCPVRYRSADSGFLHRVRHADPFNARNRPEAGGHRQHSTGAEGECRRIHDGVVRP